MAHSHILVDDDNKFIIDGNTRQITNITGNQPTVQQFDHNSETLTFQMPRHIEGHDMSLCDKVEILWINTGKGTSASTRPVAADVNEISDLAVSDEDPEILTFSWPINKYATQYAGTLVFQFAFTCYGDAENDALEFSWYTDQYSFVNVRASLHVSDIINGAYPNVIADLIQQAADHDIRVENFRQEIAQFGSDIDSFRDDKLDSSEAERTYVKQETFNQTNDAIDELRDISETHIEKANTVVNTDPDYVKSVPETSAPYAEVTKIGGMTRKCTNLLHIPDTETEFLGVTVKITDGIITLSGTATSNGGRNNELATVTLPAGTYVMSGEGTVCLSRVSDGSYVVNGSGTSFALSEETTLRLGFNFVGGTVYSRSVYIMLNAGSTALPYESYFEGLRSASVIEVESMGANLHNRDTDVLGCYKHQNKIVSHTVAPSFYSEFIEVEELATYACSKIISYVDFYNSNKDLIGFEIDVHGFTVPYGCKYVTISSISTNDVSLVKGSITPSSDLPYVRHVISIPEAVRALEGYGEGLNETFHNAIEWCESGKKIFNRNVKVLELNGSEAWGIDSGGNRFYVDDPACAKTQGKVLSSRYTANIWDALYIDMADTGVTTAQEFKEILAANPLYVACRLATPEVIDITDMFPVSNVIGVEAGGTIRFVNEHEYGLPSTVNFYENSNETVGADLFVGNLVGTAASAMCDGDGNDITDTYVPITRKVNNKALSDDITLSASDVGATPAGYAEEHIVVSAAGDMDNSLAAVFDSMRERTKKVVYVSHNIDESNTIGVPGGNWFFSLYKYASDYGVIEGTRYDFNTSNPPLKITKNRASGNWGDWMWINPPMQVGVEYRTTERWMGKAVYTKLIDCGLIEGGDVEVTTNIANATPIRCSSVITSYMGPNISPHIVGTSLSNSDTAYVSVKRSNGYIQFVVYAGSNRGGDRVYVQIWYIEEVDL